MNIHVANVVSDPKEPRGVQNFLQLRKSELVIFLEVAPPE